MDDALDKRYAQWASMLLEPQQQRSGDYAHPVFGAGSRSAQLMLIGEAPGGDEAKAGRPFVGKAGKQLDALLACAGIAREAIFITNAVKYRPTNVKGNRVSNRTPAAAEWKAGLPLLREELRMIHPRIIATLGNTPLQAVLFLAGHEKSDGIGALHGRAQTIAVDNQAYTLFPLYHPASVIYNPSLTPVLRADLCSLGAVFAEKEEQYAAYSEA